LESFEAPVVEAESDRGEDAFAVARIVRASLMNGSSFERDVQASQASRCNP
jgi:hypothetical protein